ncbi:MAG: hypothetical protein ACD_21C00038G0001 [uncultured bacterium]|nr:MAG: hypothetical protein ACD_21C00038G0001 [uncultured bacterium]
MATIKRVFQDQPRSFFLFGPRGVGKSTWMREQYQGALWIDLLDPQTLRNFVAKPERLFDLIDANPSQSIVVIDEVQKVPTLLSVVHSLIEKKRGIKFILSGSSARKLKRTSADLLGGRALKCSLHPFIASELGKDFSLETALRYGMLPLVHKQEDPQKILHAYISLYLHEEIQAEGLVRNIEYFARFLETISFSHGSLLNATNIARECEVKRKTVENYIDILEELLLCYQLPVFTKKAKRQLISHKKFYLFDSGVFATLRPKGVLDRPEEVAGVALEGLVAQHLQAWNDYSNPKHQVAFWRTRTDLEVDFIVYGSLGFWAIEVKNTKHIRPEDLRGLKAFLDDYPMAKAILLYRGTERIMCDNILCIPCENFLVNLKPNQPLT